MLLEKLLWEHFHTYYCTNVMSACKLSRELCTACDECCTHYSNGNVGRASFAANLSGELRNTA